VSIAFGIVFISILYVRHSTHGYLENISSKIKAKITMETEMFEATMDSHILGLLFCSETVEHYLTAHQGDPAAYDEIAKEFRLFAENLGVYDQVRFVDHKGMEAVRVNLMHQGATIVPREELQYKGDRYYFQKAMLAGSGFYVSKFDLNVERGQVVG